MREIKFRVWDKQRKIMRLVQDLSFGEDGSGKTLIANFRTEEGYDYGLVHGESGELMQFTGLKDKNGKEIYEGDIVKWGHVGGDWYKENPPRVAVVEYGPDLQFRRINGGEKEEAYQYVFSYGNFAYRGETEKCIEILGNIYENPELLKVESPNQ